MLISHSDLWADFLALCDCGGRRAGTPSEEKALNFARKRLSEIAPGVRVETVAYAGWRLKDASLTLPGGAALTCNPLLGSQSTPEAGVTAQVCDLGRGAPEDFERRAADIPGRFVVVRHEYPFSAQHVHRRRKLAWAMERGAAGFIIANPHPGAGAVSGSSGRAGQPGIPAVGTDFESAARLAQAGEAKALLKVSAEDYPGETSVLVLDLPGAARPLRQSSGQASTGSGRTGWVVLSAHIDGHDLAESAMDNGTGVAAALAIARDFSSRMSESPRGLRVCLFSAEEWALAGSQHYLDRMSPSERESIVLNVNLDTVAGDRRLSALTSEFPQLDAFVREFARAESIDLGTYLPTMSNSDHYNFARHGIPALRLVAGFETPASNIRYILTRGDSRDKVARGDLEAATSTAAKLVWRGLTMSDAEASQLRTR